MPSAPRTKPKRSEDTTEALAAFKKEHEEASLNFLDALGKGRCVNLTHKLSNHRKRVETELYKAENIDISALNANGAIVALAQQVLSDLAACGPITIKTKKQTRAENRKQREAAADVG